MIATSSARAALLNLTHSLAHEFSQYGIRVNSILLGMVESAQWKRRFENRSDANATWEQWTGDIAKNRGIPMQRLGKPEEPAHALVFLASPLASYTTGAALDVSGGFKQTFIRCFHETFDDDWFWRNGRRSVCPSTSELQLKWIVVPVRSVEKVQALVSSNVQVISSVDQCHGTPDYVIEVAGQQQ